MKTTTTKIREKIKANSSAPVIWVLSDDNIGNQVQAVGLAQGLKQANGWDFVQFNVTNGLPWRLIPPAFWPPFTFGDCFVTPPDKSSNVTTGPLASLIALGEIPDLIISCGRQALGPAMEVRRRTKCKLVHIHKPRVRLSKMDLAIIPHHDDQTGDNVLVTNGSLHKITPEILAENSRKFPKLNIAAEKLKIAVLIGGNNKVYKMDDTAMSELAPEIARLASEDGHSLMVSTSKRTPKSAQNILKQTLKGLPHYFWDEKGVNPYFAMLGKADAILVTCDSVNMISEATATGKPVFIMDLPEKASLVKSIMAKFQKEARPHKFQRFTDHMVDAGFARPFNGIVHTYRIEHPNDDMSQAVAQVSHLINN